MHSALNYDYSTDPETGIRHIEDRIDVLKMDLEDVLAEDFDPGSNRAGRIQAIEVEIEDLEDRLKELWTKLRER